MEVEYRPTQAQIFEESNIFVRMITGKACVRELKLPFVSNVIKCPISSDKSKIEFPCLPEDEFSEVVLELSNTSQKAYTIEVVPPMMGMSGLTVNPLVKPLEAGRSTLVSIRYDSQFRDLDYKTMQKLTTPEIPESKNTGLVRNKRLEERIKREKQERSES
jgi:hypothetical protein